MKDDFRVLRPAILITSGLLVLGIVLHTCREAAEQRARFSGLPPPGVCPTNATGCPALKSATPFRVFPPASLPGGTFEAITPTTD